MKETFEISNISQLRNDWSLFVVMRAHSAPWVTGSSVPSAAEQFPGSFGNAVASKLMPNDFRPRLQILIKTNDANILLFYK